eukprot:GHVN01056579.1.p1 GENE.GHVN01056579.1~~GHVN01056579.1.p1  ORF type:complete len:743 (+),score=176.24 GHVN01056579.1:715-2943(+)
MLSTTMPSESEPPAAQAVNEVDVDAVLSRIDDPSLRTLIRALNEDMSAFVNRCSSRGPAVVAVIQQLDEAMKRVDTVLHTEVVACHEDLLGKVSSIGKLKEDVTSISEQVTSLRGSLKTVDANCLTPFGELKRNVRILEGVHRVDKLATAGRRFIQLVKQLKSEISHSESSDPLTRPQHKLSEVAKAAKVIKELESVHRHEPLHLIIPLEQDVKWVSSVSHSVKAEAHALLKESVRSQNRIQLSEACFAFYWLGSLWGSVEALIAEAVVECEAAFDAKGLSVTSSSIGSMNEAVMPRIESFLNLLLLWYTRIETLSKVLTQAVDPSTEVSLLKAVFTSRGMYDLPQEYYRQVTLRFTHIFGRALHDIRSLRPYLLSIYPHLHHRLTACVDGVQAIAEDASSSTAALNERRGEPYSYLNVVRCEAVAAPHSTRSPHSTHPSHSGASSGGLPSSTSDAHHTVDLVCQSGKQRRLLLEVRDLHHSYIGEVLKRVNEPVNLMLPPLPPRDLAAGLSDSTSPPNQPTSHSSTTPFTGVRSPPQSQTTTTTESRSGVGVNDGKRSITSLSALGSTLPTPSDVRALVRICASEVEKASESIEVMSEVTTLVANSMETFVWRLQERAELGGGRDIKLMNDGEVKGVRVLVLPPLEPPQEQHVLNSQIVSVLFTLRSTFTSSFTSPHSSLFDKVEMERVKLRESLVTSTSDKVEGLILCLVYGWFASLHQAIVVGCLENGTKAERRTVVCG